MLIAAEPTANLPQAQEPLAKPRYNITSANARDMAAKSAEARRLQGTEQALERFEPVPVLLNPGVPEIYTRTRLARVRAQLDRLDAMILKERNPQFLDRLAAAQAKLAEQERVLDGRPLPGSHKPGPVRAPRKAIIEPEESAL